MNLHLLKLLIICIAVSSITIIYNYKMNNKYQTETSYSIKISKDTIFVFDIHGVIVKFQTIEAIKKIISAPCKLQLISLIFHPVHIIKSLYSLYKGGVVEEVLIKSAQKYPKLQCLVPTGLEVINSQTPIQQTIDILNELKEKGYKLYILSNIGENSIEMLRKKFPDIFSKFEIIISATEKDNYIKKPSIESFNKLIKASGQEISKFILIDDKPTNILAARSHGLQSILFTSPYEFRNKLKELNVLN